MLVPLHRGAAGERRIVLIERTMHGVHGGQLAFPGGKREPTDRTALDTAVRETVEELNIEATDIRPVVELPALATATTGYRVTPVIGHLLRVPAVWRPQEREVASVLDIALDDLTEPVDREFRYEGWPRPMTFPAVPIGPHLLWGLTLRILTSLLPRLHAGEFDLTEG